MPRIVPILAALAVAIGAPVSAQGPRTARSTRITAPPSIDGRLDEAVWKTGSPLTGFVQRDPAEGEPATERTEVRFLTDGQALYIGAWLFDRDAAGIVPG